MCLFCLGGQALAQNKGSVATTASSPGKGSGAILRRASEKVELLDEDDGQVLLKTALESRRKTDSRLDCSHLVQVIYSRAGFAYPYAKSGDLYAGIDPFRRVAQPQAGDLVVWPGHVGVVVSPAQHSFFSKLRSGLGIDFYDAPYWKHRGRPRFLRYYKTDAPAVPMMAREDSPKKVPPATPRLVETSAHLHQPPVVEPLSDQEATELSSTQADLSHNLSIRSKKPSSEHVKTAVLSLFTENGEKLKKSDVFGLMQPLTVVDDLQIAKVHIKGNQGWVDIRISASSSILQGRPDFKQRVEHQRWGLFRHDSETWEIALPQEVIYVPRDAAAQLFAQQLATLTQAAPQNGTAAHQKADLARLLNALLVRQ